MVDGFKSAVPGVPILQGTAQQLPFADGTVDAVFVGQVQWPGPVSCMHDEGQQLPEEQAFEV